MNPRLRLHRLLLLSCLTVMQLWLLLPARAAEPRREDVKRAVTRDLARRSPAPSRSESALARARAAMLAQDFATAHKEYRVAIDSARGIAGMEKVRAEAVRGFAESGVKLALQYKAQGRLPEAERIVREILSGRYDPTYQPAVDLLPKLRPSAPKIRGLATAPQSPKTAESPVIQPRSSPSVSRDRKSERPTMAAPPESTPPPEKEPPLTTGTRDPRPMPSQSPPVAAAAKKPLVKVYFATDRLPSGNRGPSEYFGQEWNKAGDQLLTGFVTVSIPPVHQEGKVERPWKFFTFEQKENAKKHFVLTELRVSTGDDFYAELKSDFNRSSSEDRSAFVFIHGFNVTFDAAAYSTAQIAYDLDFKGVPIMFSWPSQGRLLAYDGDEETVDFSSPHLEAFLGRVARESGASRIHLLAHSMGNRVMTRALVELARQPDIQPIFDNIIMAAPDVNTTLFTRLWPKIRVAAKRFTLYASSDDQALITSRNAKGGSDFSRLGEGGPHLVVIPGLDTVDASGIDTSLLGHSYVDSCKPVMQDLGLLIGKGFAPSKRKLRERQNTQGLGYWGFP